ncbi:hypothetical protein [Lentibacillus juripiscarius]|uniref:Phosphatase n=1 Tax=Lentibacillus juripiscarius TaxID=257446 RepID=A0ABW5V5K3_9BACI
MKKLLITLGVMATLLFSISGFNATDMAALPSIEPMVDPGLGDLD